MEVAQPMRQGPLEALDWRMGANEMRRRISVWLGTAAVLAATLAAGGAAQAQVTLNGRQVSYQARPFTIGTFLMVPLRETLAALGGGPVQWDESRLVARFTYQGNDVVIRSGSGYALVNNQAVVLGVPAVVRRNNLYIPLNFLREELGVVVSIPAGYVAPGVRASVLGFRGQPLETPRPGAIAIGGVPILTLDSAAGFGSLAERATQVTEQLTTGLERAMQLDRGAFNTSRVTLGMMDGTPVIFVAGVPVLSVTDDDAAANNTTPVLLARVWLQQMRSRLNQIFPAS